MKVFRNIIYSSDKSLRCTLLENDLRKKIKINGTEILPEWQNKGLQKVTPSQTEREHWENCQN